jgi:AmmeMemoRadiSam system protein A
MKRNIANLVTCACGEGPILTAISAAKELRADCGTLISYTNSGHSSLGYSERVVGYGAVAITVDENCKEGLTDAEPVSDEHTYEITIAQKKALLEFARKTIANFLNSETAPLARNFDPVLKRKQGAFVTLRKNDDLRGCIGHMENDRPLCETIGSMALQSAFNDPRFKPLAADELPDIEIEISVLTPYQKVDDAEEIMTGRDGVLLKKEKRQAVFLPQVATERNWNRYELLDNLCIKAGLKPGSWKKDSELYTFQAIIFKESELGLLQ